MLHLMAIPQAPFAVLVTGWPFTALLNLGLTFLLWVAGVIHALFEVSEHISEKRTGRMASRLKSP